MKLKSIILPGLAILFSTSVALAHSPMKSTSPANQAMLDAVPENLHLKFAKPARVLKVVMTHSVDGALHEERLELPTKKAVEDMQLTPEFKGSGAYKIEWRALGEDGHVIKGDFTFDVAG